MLHNKWFIRILICCLSISVLINLLSPRAPLVSTRIKCLHKDQKPTTIENDPGSRTPIPTIGDHRSTTLSRNVAKPIIVRGNRYGYVISEPDFCKDTDPFRPFVLVIVHSSSTHYGHRLAIRETWGNFSGLNGTDGVAMKLLFVLGSRPAIPDLMSKIRNESETFRDILQGDFFDGYGNLTYKALTWLKWVSDYCPSASHILKIDDDVFVNRFGVSKMIKRFHDTGVNLQKAIICANTHIGLPVLRKNTSKWHVDFEDYPYDTYPTFCAGAAYIISGDLPEPLYKASLTRKFFWIDDVYVTGFLRLILGIDSVRSLFSTAYRRIEKIRRSEVASYMFVHLLSSSRPHYDLWQMLVGKPKERVMVGNVTQNDDNSNGITSGAIEAWKEMLV